MLVSSRDESQALAMLFFISLRMLVSILDKAIGMAFLEHIELLRF